MRKSEPVSRETRHDCALLDSLDLLGADVGAGGSVATRDGFGAPRLCRWSLSNASLYRERVHHGFMRGKHGETGRIESEDLC